MLGLCRMVDGLYQFAENTTVCDNALANALANGDRTSGCKWGGSNTDFAVWDPFNAIDWTGGGNCEVILGDGAQFGEWWEVGPCGIRGWQQDTADAAGGTWSVISLGLGRGLADSRTCGSRSRTRSATASAGS